MESRDRVAAGAAVGRAVQGHHQVAHVELRAVEKRFGPVRVLADIDVVVVRGSIHALVGENGAGKSTLGKIITGLHRPDGGELRVDGALADYGSPRDALRDGLTIVAQELSLMPARTVAENVFLGSEKGRLGLVHDADTTRRYETLEAQIGFGLPADAMVGSLRLADQQKVEILRAVARDARLIVMDEPTAALEKDEQARLQLSDELEPKAKKWSRYQTLIHAFGRDGIPALIIENAACARSCVSSAPRARRSSSSRTTSRRSSVSRTRSRSFVTGAWCVPIARPMRRRTRSSRP